MKELCKRRNPSKSVVMAGLMILVIFIYGCNNNSSGSGSGGGGTITNNNVYRGSNALGINFIRDMPPAEVYDENSEFVIGLELKNEGTQNISEGILSVGVESDYIEMKGTLKQRDTLASYENIEGKNNAIKFNVGGKSILTPNGEKGIVYFSGVARKLQTQSQSLQSKISVNACYNYKTIAVPIVCIDTDFTNNNPFQKSCVVNDVSMDSQGAPVAITSVKYKMLPRGNMVEPEFFITIENKGNGEVINPLSGFVEGVCGLSSDIFEKNKDDENEKQISIFNVVKVSVFLGADQKELDCIPKDGLKLKDKKSELKCTLESGIETTEGTYSTPLQIIIEYGYTLSASKDILIKKSGQ